MKREHALKLREMLHKASASLTDEDALEAIELFPMWAVGVDVVKGDRRRYEGKLYRCEQNHTTQADWTPDKTPALWTEVSEPGEIPVWKQPTGSQDAYQMGDKVYYPTKDDDIFVSLVNDNVWPPDVYGWRKE